MLPFMGRHLGLSREGFLATREITTVPLFVAVGCSDMSRDIRLSAESNHTTGNGACKALFAAMLVGNITNSVEGMVCVDTHGRG